MYIWLLQKESKMEKFSRSLISITLRDYAIFQHFEIYRKLLRSTLCSLKVKCMNWWYFFLRSLALCFSSTSYSFALVFACKWHANIKFMANFLVSAVKCGGYIYLNCFPIIFILFLFKALFRVGKFLPHHPQRTNAIGKYLSHVCIRRRAQKNAKLIWYIFIVGVGMGVYVYVYERESVFFSFKLKPSNNNLLKDPSCTR